MFSGLKQEGYLVEAHLSVEESKLSRGVQQEYWYTVKQRNKEVIAAAYRSFNIPLNTDVKGKHWAGCDQNKSFVFFYMDLYKSVINLCVFT